MSGWVRDAWRALFVASPVLEGYPLSNGCLDSAAAGHSRSGPLCTAHHPLVTPPPASHSQCPFFPTRQSASFTAPRVIVRPGLGSLPCLADLRFRSATKPLSFHAAGAGSAGRHGGGAPLLPAHLVKLKLEGCRLSEVGLLQGRLRVPALQRACACTHVCWKRIRAGQALA